MSAACLCAGKINLMPVSMFENKPQRCPFGHQLWPGKAQVSWQPCICAPAREAAERGRGMGHLRVMCNACHDQLRATVFYEPPHDLAIVRWPAGRQARYGRPRAAYGGPKWITPTKSARPTVPRRIKSGFSAGRHTICLNRSYRMTTCL